MASNADISSFLSDAETLALTPTQLEQMCDRAIAALLIRPDQSYTTVGRSFTAKDLGTLQRLRQYYRELRISSGSPLTSRSAEFVSG